MRAWDSKNAEYCNIICYTYLYFTPQFGWDRPRDIEIRSCANWCENCEIVKASEVITEQCNMWTVMQWNAPTVTTRRSPSRWLAVGLLTFPDHTEPEASETVVTNILRDFSFVSPQQQT